MTEWSRANDRVIAEKCEGLKLQYSVDVEDYLYEGSPSTETGDRIWFAAPSYSTDLAAVFRASEAWRKQDDDVDRTITISSAVERMDLPFRVEASENYRDGENYEWRTFNGSGDTYAEALAWALYKAVGGAE